MRNYEMHEHLIKILNRYSMRTDLINSLYLNDDYSFKQNVTENEMWLYYVSVCKELNISNRIMRSKGIDSEGGKKMKIEGHINEDLVKIDLLTNNNNITFKNVLKENETIVDVICDGIKSKKVDSIFKNKKTTSKCDVKIISNLKEINLSIKKSESGQVHLNNVNQFIKGYETIFTNIPDIVKSSLLFLFSGHHLTNVILNDPKFFNPLTNKMELRHNTLTVDTMNKYDPELSINLLSWIKNNIRNICEIVFKRGWCINQTEWVDYIYYKNMIDNNQIDHIYNVNKLIEIIPDYIDEIKFGPDGTTILLPFGSVQYHLNGLQFHHNRKKIDKLFQ